ncbi:unnamed protein product [Owenia fusiformis]|uniref:Leucine-rich repeat flightless-interacting protein 2 n=1 Tax=Owenia fusiformis TaxID=6347 RepID=A0A8S4P4V7_OWEFU|nr:unnamed protein product [Owenia fusiformis]
MSTPTSGGRRRGATRTYSAEDHALSVIAREAEGRLVAKRQARAEARGLRMKELEKQAREEEFKQDRQFEKTNEYKATTRLSNMTNYSGSRRGSDDSSEEGSTTSRELKKELADLEMKYKNVQVTNAQLDNEKQTIRFQLELLKDQIEEMEETLTDLQRQYKDKNRQYENQKRDFQDLQRQFDFLQQQLKQRDELIEEHGLVLVGGEGIEEGEGEGKKTKIGTAALVTPEAAQLLENDADDGTTLGGATLDEKLKNFATERKQLLAQIKKLKDDLETEKERNLLTEKYNSPVKKSNGPDPTALIDMQKDTNRQINDYKFKLQKAQQEITTLDGSVIRLESQVKRYKTAAENSEKVEEDLKQEKRKLQRELRETQNSVEELQSANNHLQKRLEKVKSDRRAIMNT